MASRAFRSGEVGLRTPPTRTIGPSRTNYFNSQPAYTEPEPKKSRTGWIIFWVIVAVAIIGIILGIILWLVLRNNSSNSGGGTGGGGSSTTQPVGGPCTTNSNCNTGLICSNNICKQPPRGNCSSTSDCIAGYVCAGGTCLGNTGGTCTSNEQCLGAYECVSTQCTLISCNSDADCRGGYICNTTTNICEGGVNDTCNSPTQCQPSIPFQSGTMQGPQSFCSSIDFTCGGFAGDSCADNSECAYPTICTDGVCSYIQCTGDGDCPPSDIGTVGECVDGSCVMRPGGNFFVDPRCTNDSQCDPRSFENGQTRVCNFQVCALRSNQDCTPYQSDGAVCMGPVFPSPCPFVGTCFCQDDIQCPADMPICNTGTFLCEAAPIAALQKKENKFVATLPNRSIATNMGKKQKDTSIRKRIRNNPNESDEEEIEITSQLPKIKSSSIIPQFENIPDKMLSRY